MNLKNRWKRLMSELGLSENNEMYEALISAYSESHRHYHDLSHLKMVLTQFARVEQLAENKSHVEMALWFHDAIYKPFSSTNEKDSATWACDFLIGNGVVNAIGENVSRLVMATSHLDGASSNDESLIVDIDLTVLGLSKDAYEKYTEGVRREYKFVPTFIYKRKRKALIRSFLAKKRVFYNEQLDNKFGDTARRNLLSELDNL